MAVEWMSDQRREGWHLREGKWEGWSSVVRRGRAEVEVKGW